MVVTLVGLSFRMLGWIKLPDPCLGYLFVSCIVLSNSFLGEATCGSTTFASIGVSRVGV